MEIDTERHFLKTPGHGHEGFSMVLLHVSSLKPTPKA